MNAETFQLAERVLRGTQSEAAEAVSLLAASESGVRLFVAVARMLGVELRLEREGRPVGTELVLPGTRGVGFRLESPGRCRLLLFSGQVLWEREIRASEILSALAQPTLRAAAQTSAFVGEPTFKTTVAGGALTLRIFPGRESGTLVCTLKK